MTEHDKASGMKSAYELALEQLERWRTWHIFNEEQIEARMFTLRHAYRAARQLAREIVHGGSPGQTS